MSSTFEGNRNKKVISECLEEPIYEGKAITKEEKELILNKFNRTYVEFDKEKTVVDIFEEQVGKTPNNISVVFKDKKLTYRELNERSNALARALRKKGVGPDVIVGIMVEKSIEMIVGIMAILKAGGAYLPIDPEYPKDRIEYMLEDSRPLVLLGKANIKDKINFNGLMLDVNEEIEVCKDCSGIENINSCNDLAYIVYTSGSTGKPKGVMVEHKSLANLCNWHNKNYEVTEKDKVAKYAGTGFDASVWEIFPYIIKGVTLYIISDDIRLNIEELNKYYEENGITIGFLPTVIFEKFIELENKSLRKLLTGADKLKYFKKKSYDLYNNYGPTEYTVVSTSFKIDGDYKNIPIGKPISNTRIYILDKNNNMVPIGVTGELCISGDGLARGYLNNEKLTAEKFIDNPYEPGQKMYKTGDLARWLPNGNIEYLGRIDDQVKIRGFRIELGEIEHIIRKIDDVNDVLVVARKNSSGENELNAYIISEDLSIIKNVREKLKTYLPEYMIPAKMTIIDKFPLTSNGKLDKKALPEIKAASQETYIPPTNPLEEEIVGLWGEILDVDFIGIDDNFLELGGHSLIANKIVYRINKTYEINLSLVEFLTMGLTVRSLSKIIEEKLFDSISEEELSCMLAELDD